MLSGKLNGRFYFFGKEIQSKWKGKNRRVCGEPSLQQNSSTI
jgi:hypothetical protein